MVITAVILQWWTSSICLVELGAYLAATSVRELAFFGGGFNSFGLSARVDVFNSTSAVLSNITLSEACGFLAATLVQELALFGGDALSGSGNVL